MVTATWCNANVLNLFWITIGASKAPFSLLPLTPLQDGNQPRAPTTQTRHSGHALVQWGSCGDHLVAGVNTRLYLLNLHTRVVLWYMYAVLVLVSRYTSTTTEYHNYTGTRIR